MAYSAGSSSSAQILTDDDDIFPAHINELRQSNPTTYVVGQTANSQYYCDGTADDVQIQQALDAANTAGGGRVYIKNGTYNITAILAMGSNTVLEGESWATVLQIATGSSIAACIKATSKSNITVRNLRVSGQDQEYTQTGIYFTACSVGTIEQCYVEDMGGTSSGVTTGIGIASDAASTYIKVIHNYVTHCQDYGINFNNCLYCDINNNFINDGGHHGIGITNGSDYCNENNNIIYITVGKDGTAGDGITVRKDSAADCIGNVLQGNIIIGSNKTLVYAGIIVDGTTNLIINGNSINSASNGIIYSANNPTGTIVTNNVFREINSTVITGTNTDTLYGHNQGWTLHTFVAEVNLTVDDGDNYRPLYVSQGDVTNNPTMAEFYNAGTNHGIYIEQSGVLASAKNALTVYSNAAQTGGQLVVIYQDNASSNAGVVEIENDGTGNGLLIDQNANAAALNIDKDCTVNNTRTWAATIASDNAGTGTALGCGIDMSSFSVDEPILKAVNDAISTAGTLTKQIAVDIDGVTYYLYAYTTGS